MILHYKSALVLALLPALHAADKLDHVGIVVHDLAAAEREFHDLGFTIGLRGWLPDGTMDTSIDLKSGQYLELISVTDRAKASVRQGDLVAFSDQQEGPFMVALETSSAGKTAEMLRRRGVQFDGPTGNAWTLDGVKEQFPEGWLRVRLHELPIWFIESHKGVWNQLEKKYPQLKEDRSAHANGAIAIRSVSIGVKDVDAAKRIYEHAGIAFVEGSGMTITLSVTNLSRTIDALHRTLPIERGCVTVEAKNTKISFCAAHD